MEYEETEDEKLNRPNDINHKMVSSNCYYLFAFCNVSYHHDFSDSKKVVFYYNDIPLFSSHVECIDEGRTQIIPLEFFIKPYYIIDSFRYLVFEFVLTYLCGNYSGEAKSMIKRVVPFYKNDNEHEDFLKYIEDNGFSYPKIFRKQIKGEALNRMKKAEICNYLFYGKSTMTDNVSKELKGNTDLGINFADPCNEDYIGISNRLSMGKMLVDWLDEWRFRK